MGIFARSSSMNWRAGSVVTPVCCLALRGSSWSTVKVAELAVLVSAGGSSVTDGHIRRLLAAGHSADEVFECIAAAAVGAGLAAAARGRMIAAELPTVIQLPVIERGRGQRPRRGADGF
jgi:hypothetical protein